MHPNVHVILTLEGPARYTYVRRNKNIDIMFFENTSYFCSEQYFAQKPF